MSIFLEGIFAGGQGRDRENRVTFRNPRWESPPVSPGSQEASKEVPWQKELPAGSLGQEEGA